MLESMKVLLGYDGSAMGHVFLGSCSQMVLTHARGSVRAAAISTPVGVSHAGDAGAYNSVPLDVAPPQEAPGEKWLREAIRAAVDLLTQAGLRVKQVVREGGAKHQIIEEADAVGADCTFLGSRG